MNLLPRYRQSKSGIPAPQALIPESLKETQFAESISAWQEPVRVHDGVSFFHRAVLTIVVLVLLFLVSFSVFACIPITFSGNRASVPGGGSHLGLWDFFPQHDSHIRLGWYVPEGQFLGITTITFASKFIINGGNHRSSYLVLRDLLTVTEHQPLIVFSKPLVLSSGFLLTGWIWNNSPEAQNMNFLIDGYLSTDPLFRDCK